MAYEGFSRNLGVLRKLRLFTFFADVFLLRPDNLAELGESSVSEGPRIDGPSSFFPADRRISPDGAQADTLSSQTSSQRRGRTIAGYGIIGESHCW